MRWWRAPATRTRRERGVSSSEAEETDETNDADETNEADETASAPLRTPLRTPLVRDDGRAASSHHNRHDVRGTTAGIRAFRRRGGFRNDRIAAEAAEANRKAEEEKRQSAERDAIQAKIDEANMAAEEAERVAQERRKEAEEGGGGGKGDGSVARRDGGRCPRARACVRTGVRGVRALVRAGVRAGFRARVRAGVRGAFAPAA